MKHKRAREGEKKKNLYFSLGTIKQMSIILLRVFFSRDTLHITSHQRVVNRWVNRSEQKHLVLITAPRSWFSLPTLNILTLIAHSFNFSIQFQMYYKKHNQLGIWMFCQFIERFGQICAYNILIMENWFSLRSYIVSIWHLLMFQHVSLKSHFLSLHTL